MTIAPGRPLEHIVRSLSLPEPGAEPSAWLTHEWLVTNGLGGYASGTVAGVATRRYHGYLIAALANPLGRTVMLGGVHERVMLPDGAAVELGGEDTTEHGLALPGMEH
ncbi:MAG: glycogen debranching enzyme N-terminal domain-containing protein, partial [Gemmatimonadota bacterium]